MHHVLNLSYQPGICFCSLAAKDHAYALRGNTFFF